MCSAVLSYYYDVSEALYYSCSSCSNIKHGLLSNCGVLFAGLLNFVVEDADGSILGDKGQIVSSNSMAIGQDSRCSFNNEWNSYACIGTSYAILNFESQDVDRYSRRVNPVVVEGIVNGSPHKNSLNCYMDRRWDDDYTSLLRLSRFPAVVELNNEYNITFAGTNPRTLK